MSKIRLFFSSYIVLIIALFFYSFTQVDLSLTLSRISIYQIVEKNFQYVGYFNRPLSTAIYLILLFLLTLYYCIFIYLAYKNKIKARQVFNITIISTVILVFSYNAFSYDLFNYIFDAKIITHYHLNPFLYKALDFPKDPMLSFMHWTHRTFPYGPFWLVMTVPFSFLGLGFFLPTFFLFKALVSATFIATLYYISKIVKEISPKHEAFSLAFFALSPLTIIEVLVDSHNDMPMMFFAILSIYFALKRKWFLSITWVVLSFLTKQSTIFMVLPVILYVAAYFKKWNFSFDNFLKLSTLFMFGALIFVISKIEIQPWYYLWVLPLISIFKPNKYLFFLSTGFSLGLLLRYAPFLYIGDWNGLVPVLKFDVTLWTTIIFLIAAVIIDIYSRLQKI